MSDDPKDAPKSFAEWMRSGAALNMPGGMAPPSREPSTVADAEWFSLPPDDEGDEAEFFAMKIFRREGADDRRLQNIARGKVAVEDEIDLHGWSAEEAHSRLEDFLRRALGGGARVVEVVHGRGLRAEDGRGVLRAKTRKWLAGCDMVLGFVEPRNNSGAVRVWLRKNFRRG